MSKIIWIDDLVSFKIIKVYPSQCLCNCSEQYKNDLNMEVGDIVFMKHRIKPNFYRRLGEIKQKWKNYIMISFIIGASEEQVEND